jgi:hypothetical protein
MLRTLQRAYTRHANKRGKNLRTYLVRSGDEWMVGVGESLPIAGPWLTPDDAETVSAMLKQSAHEARQRNGAVRHH